MIGTLDVECQAKNPNLPLAPMTAFVNSPSSLRIRNVPKRIGDWCIRNVYVTCVYPDATTKSVQCVLVGGVYVGTIQGTSTSGISKNGYTIFADGTDENGNNVTGYVLGKGDINILEADGQLNPDAKLYYVHLLSSEGQTHSEGDLWQVSGTYYIWQNSQAWPIGDDSGVIGELSAKVDEKADLSSVHSDYIEDASGYKIEASLSCRVKDFTLPWSLTGNSHSYSLQYDSNSRKWTYVETDAQKIELSYETINDSDIVLWELDFYVWDGMMSEWHFDAGYTTTADEEVTELYLNNEFWHATRSIIGTDKLATESYVDSHIGNINAVLDVINGEVI